MMRRGRLALAGIVLAAAFALIATAAGAGTNSTTLDNGAELSVSVDTPTTGDTFLLPTGSTSVNVPVTGSASIGEGQPNVHWTYVVDVSGSTSRRCDGGTILDCEKLAVANLNTQIATDGSAVDVGLAVYGSSGASADMSAAGGQQPLNAPSSGEVGTVISSISIGRVAQFTNKTVGSGSTNFTAGLTAALTSVGASSAGSKNVVFLSDGLSNTGGGGFNAAVTNLANAGATIYSFAVGSGSSCTGGNDGTLQAMANATGGTCTPVPNPANLPDIIQNVTATEMTGVSLTVDAAATAFDSISPTPPFDGPDSTDFTATALNQTPGSHQVCATATGTGPKSDSGSELSVTQCETYLVYAFGLSPATETNELGMDNSHTVTATVTGAAGELEGFTVSFSIDGAPAGSGPTDANGDVEFTYTVPVEPGSLGTDTISATVDINGDTATVEVEKIWVDTTPPVAACEPGPNPGGNEPEAPGEGGQGQNQDGFYTIGGSDDVWPDEALEVFVTDAGSGEVFGHFPVGTNIKYTQNNSTPGQRPGTGAVDWRINGTGDAVVTVVDGSGNISDGVDCLVPRPPQ